MYQKHFKLGKRVFVDAPSGADMFVSPQSAESLSRMKQALGAPDTVTAVTGHSGVGKSTLVARALNTVSGKSAIVRIGEKKLDPDDALEMLLVALGTTKVPAGTIQKLRFFRQLMDHLAKQKSRVFIVIEDTAKTSPETLSELEALTAADTGFSCGANILLMANGSLDDLLGLPILARLNQRARLRETVQPFTPGELRGYLIHSFRQAGTEFENLFGDGAVELLHTFSGGIARAVNKLVESVLTEAARKNAVKVELELIKRAAMEEFGLAAEAGGQAAAPAAPDLAADNAEQAVPDLIQDTLPQIEVLKPELVGGGIPQQPAENPAPPKQENSSPSPPTVAATAAPAENGAAPTASDVAAAPVQANAPVAAAKNEDVPAWDRDPTVAELRPDLDALEHAMAVAQGRGAGSKDEDVNNQAVPPNSAEAKAEPVPEITLDNSIQKKVDQAEIDLQKSREEEAARRVARAKETGVDDGVAVTPDLAELELQQRSAEEARQAANASGSNADHDAEAASVPATATDTDTAHAANDAKNSKLSPTELQQIAADLAKAKTIEDVDDKMAETLFGEEINLIAAQVVANPPAAEPAASAAQQITAAEAANSPHEPAVASPAAPLVNGQGTAPGMTQSQRFRTVKSLNADGNTKAAPATTPTPANAAPQPPLPPATDQPDSIEEQFSTSVTQSLQTLDENAMPGAGSDDQDIDDDDDDDDTRKSGFFSRFRRS